MNYASIGKRLLAALIDSLVVGAIGTVIFPYSIFMVISSSLAITVIYEILTMGSSWHATLGQKALNIQVVDQYGNGIDYTKAAGRAFAALLSDAILGIGYIVGLFDSSYQTLHDKIAGTYVVEAYPSVSPSAPPASGGTGSIIGISGEKAGMRFPVYGNGIMIGRDTAVCQVIMKNSSGVSRLHCLVSYNPASGMYIVTDRNSTYGTFTENGERITPSKSIALKRGERFYLGSRSNMFELG